MTMTKIMTKPSLSVYARVAGVLYFVITVAAIFAHMYIPSQFIVPGDGATTAANILADETTFRLGTIGAELIVLLSEIVLSVILYVLFRPVSKTLSLMAAVSRLAMTTMHGLNLINYYFVLQLIRGPEYARAFEPAQINALTSLFLEAHGYGFTLGIAFLTIHVFLLGVLIFRSGYFPKIFGLLFMAAGVGYLIDSFALLLTTSYVTTPAVIALLIATAELAFPLWLLVKGVGPEAEQKQVQFGY